MASAGDKIGSSIRNSVDVLTHPKATVKTIKLNMVAHTCNANTGVKSQAGTHSK